MQLWEGPFSRMSKGIVRARQVWLDKTLMARASLIVSLHDISPQTFGAARRQVEELCNLGVGRTTLLAIPFHHGRKRLDADPALCAWLRALQTMGHEVALHGWRHDLVGINPVRDMDPVRGRWFWENIYTNREAEFLALGREAARERITRGLTMFRDLGLLARGFIAPAWLMSRATGEAARDLGLPYTNTISEIIQLPTGRRHPARSCVWSVRAHWRRLASQAWNRLLFQRLTAAEPLRISLHPCDTEHPAIWRQIRHMIRRALEDGRTPTPYAEWLT